MPKKLPRVRVLSLPPFDRKNLDPASRLTPGPRTIAEGYNDPEAVYQAAADALVVSLSWLSSGSSVPPAPTPTMEALGMVRHVGRQLWSWTAFWMSDEHFFAAAEAMLPVVLRPTAMLPPDIAALSPRFALLLTLESAPAADELVLKLLGHWGITRIKSVSMGGALSQVDYGLPVPPLFRLDRPGERPAYNLLRQSLLHAADYGDLPLPYYALTQLPALYYHDQARRLRGAVASVRTALQEVAKATDGELAGLLNEGEGVEAAMDWFMTGTWLDGLQFDPEDVDEAYTALLRRAVVYRMARPGTLPPAALLALSVLSGISPASFARHAVRDWARRSVTYTTPSALEELANLVRDRGDYLAGRQRAAAEACAVEIERAAEDLDGRILRVRDESLALVPAVCRGLLAKELSEKSEEFERYEND